MNKIFYEMIFRRKSFHLFRNVGNEKISKDELNDIQSAYSDFTPLNPGIKTAIRIVPEKQTNCKRGGEYCVLLYSEKKDGYDGFSDSGSSRITYSFPANNPLSPRTLRRLMYPAFSSSFTPSRTELIPSLLM